MTIGRLCHIIFDCVRLCMAVYAFVFKDNFMAIYIRNRRKMRFCEFESQNKVYQETFASKKYSFFNVWPCTAMKVRGLCRDVAKSDKTDTNTNVL